MRHRRRRGKLGVKTNHRKALLRNLVKSLVVRKRIQTTLHKAKAASALADQMVTLAKRGDLHARRQLISDLGCSKTAHSLITEIAPQFKQRQGGYTRVLRLGYRVGDGAQTALLEFTMPFALPEKTKKPKKEKKAAEISQEEKIEKTPKKLQKHDHDEEPKRTSEKKKSSSSKEKDSDKKDPEKKESEKKGGFLGALRKFLKGDEQ